MRSFAVLVCRAGKKGLQHLVSRRQQLVASVQRPAMSGRTLLVFDQVDPVLGEEPTQCNFKL